MRESPQPLDGFEARAASDALLRDLRAGSWLPAAWLGFLAAALARSSREAARRPAAVAQATTLHALVAIASGRRRWPAVSWAMTVLHLGQLGRRRTLGADNLLTLTRANLPAFGSAPTELLALTALASDIADGRLARRRGGTLFGAYADSFADAAFWTWFTGQRLGDRRWAAAGLAAWALPVLILFGASFSGGAVRDAPRPLLLRPAGALQWLVTAYVLLAGRRRDR